MGPPEPPPYFAWAGKVIAKSTSTQVHKSRMNLECRMENSAGIGRLKSILQSLRLRVFLNLHMLALLRTMALIAIGPEMIIILFIASKYKDLLVWISR